MQKIEVETFDGADWLFKWPTRAYLDWSVTGVSSFTNTRLICKG